MKKELIYNASCLTELSEFVGAVETFLQAQLWQKLLRVSGLINNSAGDQIYFFLNYLWF